MRNVLRPYRLHATTPPPTLTRFERVQGRSPAARVADAYQRSDLERRASIVESLLASVGSLALAAVAGGAFARSTRGAMAGVDVPITAVGALALAVVAGGAFARPGRDSDGRGAVLTRGDAVPLSAAQVHELARYVEQSDPPRFANLLQDIAGARH